MPYIYIYTSAFVNKKAFIDEIKINKLNREYLI